ncbi:CpaF family protein [Candidatus Gracilibacteria bacterium]|nr:CpaF family protein [Candidatus Gracilibacteria bacterium]
MQTNLLTIQQKLYEKTIAFMQQQNETVPHEIRVREIVQKFLNQEQLFVPKNIFQRLLESITFAIIGFGPLEFLLRDDDVSEIMVNGFSSVFVEKNGSIEKTCFSFLNEKQLIQTINRIVGKVGRRIDESHPLVDARLADGSRVNAIIPPLSLCGATLTIRKFPKKIFVISDMLNRNSLTQKMADFLETAVVSKQNIIISGGTGAGKTSTLNACASLIPHKERLITIEDAAEIRINHPHLVSLESRTANLEDVGEISIRTLLKNALRMRPDRIVVGEIRGEEAIDMLQAMNTGHKGSLTTVHANSPLESLYRIETMVLLGASKIPLSAIRPQIIQGIDIVIQQQRLPSGERKIIKISKMEKEKGLSDYTLKDLFVFNLKTNKFEQL